MTKPTTPTGKEAWRYAASSISSLRDRRRADILAIEREAVETYRTSEEHLQALDDAMSAGAAAERERLLEKAVNGHKAHGFFNGNGTIDQCDARPCQWMRWLLADPEDAT